MNNKYFRVESPFRVWCNLGHSDSNTHIGRSRVINVVKEARNAIPGDEIHALVGGTFLIRDDAAWEVSLSAPKSVLEKTYLLRPDWAELPNDPRVAEILAPTRTADYNAIRSAVSANRMRPLHPQVIDIEPSPEMVRVRALIAPSTSALREEGRAFKVAESDIDAYHSSRIRLTIEGVGGKSDRYVEVTDGPRGMVTVDLPVGEPVQGLPFEYPSKERGRIYLRPETWPDPGQVAMRVLYEFVHRGAQAIEDRETRSVTAEGGLDDIAAKVEEESNAPFLRLQMAVGAEDGGLAALHWNGSVADGICRDLAKAVLARSGGTATDHGSPWEALSREAFEGRSPFQHSTDLDEEPIHARDLFLDNVEKRFGVKLGAVERRDIGRRIDDVLEPYFRQERQWAADAADAPAP